MASPRPKILSVSSDPMLLATRNRVLEFAGFDVTGCNSSRDCLEKFLAEEFDILVLDDSLPPEDRLPGLRQLRANYPHVRILVIYQPGELSPDLSEADAVCGSLDGPEQLIQKLSSLLSYRNQSATGCKAQAAAVS